MSIKTGRRTKMSNNGSVYTDRDGKRITRMEWTVKRGNKDYYVVRSYENDKIKVVVEWQGFDPEKARPEDTWRIFEVAVFNIIISGSRPGAFVKKLIEDPTYTKWYRTEEAAVDYYQNVLIELGCGRIETDDYLGGTEFVEIGNLSPLAAKRAESSGGVSIKTKSSVTGSW